MIPHRPLQFRQVSSRPTSSVIASPSWTDATYKSTGNATEKIAHTESIVGADASVTDITIQPNLKKEELNNDEDDPIAPFLLLPVEILEQIFIKFDDFGLLNLADTCTRFESIALAVASKRYADQYFVINRY